MAKIGRPRQNEKEGARERASISITPALKEKALKYGGLSKFFNDAAEHFLKSKKGRV